MRDFLHFWWDLIHWNARKTAFVARGRRGLAPCQSPSDSGRAWETHCEAAAGWDKQERFCRVCPAFKRGPEGWRCSVDAAQVRPHWGLAVAWWGGASVAAALMVAVAAYGILVTLGYRNIGILDALIPARWGRIAAAQRDVFLRQARNALARHDIEAMRLSLASAAAAAPDDYESRLALAQIHSHLLMSRLATAEFNDLMVRFPQHHARTALVFHDVLLSTGQFDALGKLALGRLSITEPPEQGPWLKALFVALRGSRSPVQLLDANREQLGSLPALWQEVVRVEAGVRSTGVPSAALMRLTEIPARKEHAALIILAGETLAAFAPGEQAADAIAHASPVIGAFERERLLHRLHVRAGSERLALQSFDAMLALANRVSERERMLAALVDFPDTVRVGRLAGALGNPRTPFSREEAGSIWVAAAMAGHDDVRRLAEHRLRLDHGFEVEAGVPRTFSPANAHVWLRVLPLGRETAVALVLKSARASDLAGGM